MRAWVLACATALVVTLVTAAAAQAPAPPANDARSSARPLTPDVTVDGTLVGATSEPDEPAGCESVESTIWYRLAEGLREDTVLRVISRVQDVPVRAALYEVQADGGLAVRGCLRLTRDQVGRLSSLEPGTRYLLQVGRRGAAGGGAVRIRLANPEPTEEAPGRPLPAGGASSTLDADFNGEDLYSVHMRTGRSYIVNVAQPDETTCAAGFLLRPSGSNLNDAIEKADLGCNGFALFTPGIGEGTRFTVRVAARAGALPLPYRVQVAKAGPDDSAPGIALRNYQRARGRIDALHADPVDTYRFRVKNRSVSFFRLSQRGFGSARMQLIDAKGRRRASRSGDGTIELRAGLRPGRYYLVVVGTSGSRFRYGLLRRSREITQTKVLAGGRPLLETTPGVGVTLSTQTAPAATGRVLLTISRLDPLFGYQFLQRLRITAGGGHASVGWVPPTAGRYRIHAFYLGSRDAAPSRTTRPAVVVVDAPGD